MINKSHMYGLKGLFKKNINEDKPGTNHIRMLMQLSAVLLMLIIGFSGSRSVVLANETVLANSDYDQNSSTNAIQKEVNAVLNTITSKSDSATIIVDEGEYEGGISIVKTDSMIREDIKENFVLNIISARANRDDKGYLLPDAGNEVTVKGDIRIDGINVQLGGLTISADSSITVKDAQLDLTGTKGNDSSNVVLDENAAAAIITGAGDDEINVKDTTDSGNLTLNTGDGDDKVAISVTGGPSSGSNAFTFTMQAGDGEDQVNIDAAGSVSFKESALTGTTVQANVKEGSLSLYNLTMDGSTVFSVDTANNNTVGSLTLSNLILSGTAKLAVTMKNAIESSVVTVSNVKIGGNAEASLDTKCSGVTLNGFELADHGAMHIGFSGANGLTVTDALTLPDHTYLELIGTDSDVSLVSVDVKDDNEKGLYIRTTDSNLSDGRSGNVSFRDDVKVNGKTVLDLAGSFAGTGKDSSLKICKAAYTLGSSFTFGGDFGSADNWMTVENSVEGNVDAVPLRIGKVEDVYVRGAADRSLVNNNYDTPPTVADTPISLITGLTQENIVNSIADAMQSFIDVIGSSKTSDAEKTAATEQLSDVTAALVSVMMSDMSDRGNMQNKLAELLAGIDQDLLSAELKEVVQAVLNDPTSVTEEQMKTILVQLLTDNGRRELIAAHAEGVFTTEVDPGYNPKSAAVYLDVFMNTMSDEMAEQIVADVQEAAWTDAPDSNSGFPTSGGMDIVIGESTGTDGMNINNYGEITLTQKKGDLHIGQIATNDTKLSPEASGMYDVTVTAQEGSIVGVANAQEAANITAVNINLNAAESIKGLKIDEAPAEYTVDTKVLDEKNGRELTSPRICIALKDDGIPNRDEEGNIQLEAIAYADYTRTYSFNKNGATTINAAAGGDITIMEASGDMGLGVISAPNGEIRLFAGAILDEEGKPETDWFGNVIFGTIWNSNGSEYNTEEDLENTPGTTLTDAPGKTIESTPEIPALADEGAAALQEFVKVSAAVPTKQKVKEKNLAALNRAISAYSRLSKEQRQAATVIKAKKKIDAARKALENPKIYFKNKNVSKKLNKQGTVSKYITLKKGSKLNLKTKSSTDARITYKSTSKTKVTVSKNGVIKARRKGKVTITASCIGISGKRVKVRIRLNIK